MVIGKKRQKQEFVDPKVMIALEEELAALKQEHGIVDQPKWWMKVGDFIAERKENRKQVVVNRKKYIVFGVCLGWAGGHRFYAKQYGLGVLFLLFFWTGVPFAMTLVDLMIAIPKMPDEKGMICI